MRPHHDRHRFGNHPSSALESVTRRRRRSCRVPHRSRLEVLENRQLLSSISWINPNGGNWDTASNWSSDTGPTANDAATVRIAVSSPITHRESNSDLVKSLTIPHNPTVDDIDLSGDRRRLDGRTLVEIGWFAESEAACFA